jgi:hypothetical protein
MTNPAPEFPTRAEIRAKATAICEELTAAAAAGRNPRQLSIDLLDQAAKDAEVLGPENSEKYLDMLSQEIEAVSADAGDRQRKVAEDKLGKGAWLLGVGFGAMIGLPLLFRACS